MKILRRLAKIAVAFLLVVVVAGFVLTQYRSYHRQVWKNLALTRLAEFVRDPSWTAKQMATLQKINLENSVPEAGWLSRNFVLMKNDEWMAYTNICSKEDWRVSDLFIGYGSDHQYYYSTFHFCIGAFVLGMEGQPDSLASMVKDHYLRPFDGKSDECLNKTWR